MGLVRVGLAVAGVLTIVLLLGAVAPVPSPSATPSPRLTPAAAATPYVDDWPTYLHDAARTGSDRSDRILSPATASNLSLLWNFTTQGPIADQPTVVNGTVYVGSWDGREYALNASNGTARWSTNFGRLISANCSVKLGITAASTWRSGVVYVTSGTNRLFALNASTGAIIWRLPITNNTNYYDWSSPLLVDGNAYIGLASVCDQPLVRAGLLAVSLRTHKIVESFYTVGPSQTGASIWGSPTYSASLNEIFVVTGNGYKFQPYQEAILALNATTLALVGNWTVPVSQRITDADFGTTPVLVSGVRGGPLIVANNKNGIAYAWSAKNVSRGPVWEDTVAIGGSCPECGNGSVSSDAFDGSTLYLAGGQRMLGGVEYPGSVEAVTPSTGVPIWIDPLPGKVVPAVTVSNGLVVVESGTNLTVLNSSSGSLLYSYNTGDQMLGAASVAEGCIFVGSNNHHVYAFGIATVGCGAAQGLLPGIPHPIGPGLGDGSPTWLAARGRDPRAP